MEVPDGRKEVAEGEDRGEPLLGSENSNKRPFSKVLKGWEALALSIFKHNQRKVGESERKERAPMV